MSKPIRVLLDSQAAGDILAMAVESKGKFVEVTPSKLVSWIVSRYRSKAFGQDREAIKRAHFNHRKALAQALKGAASEEELRAVCAQAMKRVWGKAKAQKEATLAGQSINEEQEEGGQLAAPSSFFYFNKIQRRTMPKKSSKSRIPWNPRIVEMIPCPISKKQEKLLLTSVAQLIYDLACQFSKEDKKTSLIAPNFLGQTSEVQE